MKDAKEKDYVPYDFNFIWKANYWERETDQQLPGGKTGAGINKEHEKHFEMKLSFY